MYSALESLERQNKSKSLEWQRKHYQLPTVKARRYRQNKAWYRRNKMKYKMDLFDLLGGAQCRRCGFNDVRALQIDHINGGGSKELKSGLGGMKAIYYYLRNPEEAKSKLQVLCANCNQIKKHENDNEQGGRKSNRKDDDILGWCSE